MLELILIFLIVSAATCMCMRAAEICKAFKLPKNNALYDNSTATLGACLFGFYLVVIFFLFLGPASWMSSSVQAFIAINVLAIVLIFVCPIAIATLSRHRQLYSSSNPSHVRKVKYKTIMPILLITLLLIGSAGAWPLTMLALRNENMPLARWLIDQEINVNTLDQWDNSPLIYTIKKGDVATVALLLDRGADVNKKAGPDRSTSPIEAACRGGYPRIVRMLIDKGASLGAHNQLLMINPDGHDKSDRYEEITLLLLSKGANINARDEEGLTAVMRFARLGRFKLAEKLLASGAELTDKERIDSCFYPLKNSYQIYEPKLWLTFCRIDVNRRDENGITPLIHAARGRNVGIVEELLRQGADPLLKDNTGKTASQYLDMRGFEGGKIAIALKKYGIK